MLLFAAAGGGGAAAFPDEEETGDAKGLLNPWLDHTRSNLIPIGMSDGGSGGGWTEKLTGRTTHIDDELSRNGHSTKLSWMGGFSCHDSDGGGFGGGGGACRGGGGGGGYIGGIGGADVTSNGHGGWSWVNPKAVLMVMDSRYLSSPSDQVTDIRNPNSDLPEIWQHIGQGFVSIMPPLYGNGCQGNCSELGATCLPFDRKLKHFQCVCPSGVILSLSYPTCNPRKFFTLQLKPFKNLDRLKKSRYLQHFNN